MVATDNHGEIASPLHDTRDAVAQSFYGASLAQGGGESGLGLPSLDDVDSSKSLHIPDYDAGQPPLATMSLHDAEWMIIEPIPPKALVTSLPPSPVETAYDRIFKPGEGTMDTSEAVAHLEEVAHESGSHSTPKSSRTSSKSMSLDSKTTVYKESFDSIRYQHPETPSIESTVEVNQPLRGPGISEQDLKLLLKLRHRVQLLRLQIQGQRRLVEVKRGVLSDADEQYIKRIRINHVVKDISKQTEASEASVLEDLWRSCQKARDDFGPAEDSLLLMEDRLEDEESRLERVEERVYKKLQSSHSALQVIGSLNEQNESISEDRSDNESLDSSTTGSARIDDVDYDDYLWRLGNLDLLQERHQDLLNEKSKLEGEQEKRKNVGMDLNVEDLDFVTQFGDIIAPVELEIEEVLRDVERLKEICIKKGLIDEEGNPLQISAMNEGSEPDSEREEQLTLRAEQSKPSPKQLPSGNNEAVIRVSPSQGGFGPFINLWLLHKLRSSALEMLLLACYVAMAISDLEGLDWQAEALRLWEKDGAGGARPDQPWKEPGSCETSMPRNSAGTGCEEEERVAIAKKAKSLEICATLTSFDACSPMRQKAKSAS